MTILSDGREWIFIYYCVINMTAFVLYGMDKAKAVKHKWRIPEKTLLGIALLGGGLGAFLGMKVFHHKTKHTIFKILVPLAMVLHICIMIFLLWNR